MIPLLSPRVKLPSIPVTTRLTYYTDELMGDVLVDLGSTSRVHLRLDFKGRALCDKDLVGPGVVDVPFPMKDLPKGHSQLESTVTPLEAGVSRSNVDVIRLDPKANGVKVDRLTGAFLTDGLPLFPFGFYCYSPVQPTLPEEEFVRGFSMISPYQDIANSRMEERKRYMDRCAELGMKVNYSLVSLSGGGSGVNLSDADREKRRLLANEIKTFKDHPALLGWYLSDEPDGENVSPASLEEQYALLKELDPYHPVLMVFNTPPKAPSFRNALDVAMADPYPIPNSNPVDAGNTIAGLRKAFGVGKPLWIVPQAFGGNEWWSREPTRQEIRLMTWQSIFNGASGVQYFVRHGLGSFPKSPGMWAECGLMAEEAFELEPFLHSAESAPAVSTDHPNVQARTWRAKGAVLVGLLNKVNVPTTVHVRLTTISKMARLPFENRTVPVKNGEIVDTVEGFGTRFYILDESLIWKHDPSNPMIDPGFEENPSAGVPSGCYLSIASDRGATARIDPRVFHTGTHSVRLIAPTEGSGMTLGFYPAPLKPGTAYRLSIWAKSAPGTQAKLELSVSPTSVGSESSRSFPLTENWTLCELPLTVASGKELVRTFASVKLGGKGIAWIDDVAFKPSH